MVRPRLLVTVGVSLIALCPAAQKPVTADTRRDCGEYLYFTVVPAACGPQIILCNCKGPSTPCPSWCYWYVSCPYYVTIVVPTGTEREWGSAVTLSCSSFTYFTGSCPGNSGHVCGSFIGCPDGLSCSPPFTGPHSCWGGDHDSFVVCRGYQGDSP